MNISDQRLLIKIRGLLIAVSFCSCVGRADDLDKNSFAFDQGQLLSDAITWSDEYGSSLKLSSFREKPVVLSMIYTDCRKICAVLTIDKLKEFQKLLDQRQLKAEFVIATFDPENDTSEKLLSYKKRMSLLRSNWHLIRNTEPVTRSFAAKLGLENYWRMDDHIIHNFRIVYLDVGQKHKRFLDADHTDIERLLAP